MMRHETRVLQSMEVGPFFSSDGAMLTSDLPLEEQPQAEPRREGTEILWCVSADDPRCSPRDSAPNDAPGTLQAARIASTTPAHPRLGPPGPSGLRPRHAIGAARLGVRDRVERPPSR
ncbi:MAG: hypothetical protein KC619_02515 [Myxococcales bacterium]|nr:hypothetical protein [Myxococcales bacterium]